MSRILDKHVSSRKEKDFLSSINPALHEFAPSGDHPSRESVIPATEFIPTENKV